MSRDAKHCHNAAWPSPTALREPPQGRAPASPPPALTTLRKDGPAQTAGSGLSQKSRTATGSQGPHRRTMRLAIEAGSGASARVSSGDEFRAAPATPCLLAHPSVLPRRTGQRQERRAGEPIGRERLQPRCPSEQEFPPERISTLSKRHRQQLQHSAHLANLFSCAKLVSALWRNCDALLLWKDFGQCRFRSRSVLSPELPTVLREGRLAVRWADPRKRPARTPVPFSTSRLGGGPGLRACPRFTDADRLSGIAGRSPSFWSCRTSAPMRQPEPAPPR
jgi:hypothetical protein